MSFMCLWEGRSRERVDKRLVEADTARKVEMTLQCVEREEPASVLVPAPQAQHHGVHAVLAHVAVFGLGFTLPPSPRECVRRAFTVR